ncbi:MAG: hypothetical protein JKY48_04255 [Flavobacteriales bacterium]|nr:hypothetical protein [Flavobacteriales bacterium]
MKKYIIPFLIFSTISCNSQSPQSSSISGFDVSVDEESILFSLNQGGDTRILEMNIENGDQTVIKDSEINTFYSNPRYSLDGDAIVFIEYDKKDLQNSLLCIAQSNGANSQYLVEGKGIISEAIFSEFKNELLFCKANEYSKSSPIGVKAAHGYDIYSFNLSNDSITKLSDLNAYSLHQIFEIDTSNILLHLGSGKDGGLMLFNKEEPDKLQKIVPKSNPRKEVNDLFDTPIYSKRLNKMAFIAPYQLYIMDMDSKEASLLFDNRGGAHVDYINFLEKKKKVIFVIKNDPNFYTINLDGSGLEKIEVRGW